MACLVLCWWDFSEQLVKKELCSLLISHGNGMDKVSCLCQEDFSSSIGHEGKLVLTQYSHVTDSPGLCSLTLQGIVCLRVWYGLIPKRVGYTVQQASVSFDLGSVMQVSLTIIFD